MLLRRGPRPALRPFLGALWTSDATTSDPQPPARERVLPTGAMHLAIRLTGRPFRFFADDADAAGLVAGRAVVGGARATPYLKDVAEPALSVGAELAPGASELLLGAPAHELAGRHTALEELWGPTAVDELGERLLAVGSSRRRLDLLEEILLSRLPRVRGLHPAVAHALERFAAAAGVAEVVRETGRSHRHFIALFRRAVGLPPKLYCRLLRFRRALHRLAADPRAPQVDVALEEGYSDQAHLVREFRALAGVTPGEHRALAPARPEHVPEPPP